MAVEKILGSCYWFSRLVDTQYRRNLERAVHIHVRVCIVHVHVHVLMYNTSTCTCN